MPRANRHSLPNHVWHITHRCHKQEFLLRFARDRSSWRFWLREARNRFGLCVLNYTVTRNHVHLLVQDRGNDEIPRSMQLIAGRTAQQYNERKGRRGAFWEDRYHATAVDSAGYLSRCLVYIDLNMVRAGVVAHPSEWDSGGYREIQNPLKRYRCVNLAALRKLFGAGEPSRLQELHRGWVEEALRANRLAREGVWSASLAVGSEAFVTGVKTELGVASRHRGVSRRGDVYCLREATVGYGGGSEMAAGG